MEKELRVRLYATENDSYVELWKVLGTKKFIGRHTYGYPRWVYISDPLGYCEVDYDIHDDVTIIVCTPDGKDLFESRNGDGSACFATKKQTAEKEFRAYATDKKEVIANTQKGYLRFKHWLLSFKDKIKYPGSANDYDENWMYGWREETKRVTLREWDYLGIPCSLQAVSYRHTVCGKIWTELVTDCAVMGYIFDEADCGPMYSKHEAEKIVEDAIRSTFGRASAVSIVVHIGGDYAQRNIRMFEAVRSLLQGDYRKTFVREVAEQERRKPSFYKSGLSGIGAIRELYPNCTCDYTYFF